MCDRRLGSREEVVEHSLEWERREHSISFRFVLRSQNITHHIMTTAHEPIHQMGPHKPRSPRNENPLPLLARQLLDRREPLRAREAKALRPVCDDRGLPGLAQARVVPLVSWAVPT